MMKVIKFIILFIFLLNVKWARGQTFLNARPDSVLFLNITITYKLHIVESYKNTISSEFLFIDFPSSYYDKKSKSVKLIRVEDPFVIFDSTIAIVRISEVVHNSLGSGRADRITQFVSGPQTIDSSLILDSVSKFGTFYLELEGGVISLGLERLNEFETHRTIKKEDALIDYITEYKVENVGYIVRRIEGNVSKDDE